MNANASEQVFEVPVSFYDFDHVDTVSAAAQRATLLREIHACKAACEHYARSGGQIGALKVRLCNGRIETREGILADVEILLGLCVRS